jgi:hypothetical protein
MPRKSALKLCEEYRFFVACHSIASEDIKNKHILSIFASQRYSK